MDDFEKEMEDFLKTIDIKLSNKTSTSNNNNNNHTQNNLIEAFQNHLNTNKNTNQSKNNIVRSSKIQQSTESNDGIDIPSPSSSSTIKDKDILITKEESKNIIKNNKSNTKIKLGMSDKREFSNDQDSNNTNLLPMKSQINPIENTEDLIIKHNEIDFGKLVEEELAKDTYDNSNNEPLQVKFKYEKKPKYIDKYKISKPTETKKYKYYADRFKNDNPAEEIEPIVISKGKINPNKNKCIVDKEKEKNTFSFNQSSQSQQYSKVSQKSTIGNNEPTKNIFTCEDKKKEIKQTSVNIAPLKGNDDLDSIMKEYHQINEKKAKETMKNIPKGKNQNKIINNQSENKVPLTAEEKDVMIFDDDDDIQITLTKRPVLSKVQIDKQNNSNNTKGKDSSIISSQSFKKSEAFHTVNIGEMNTIALDHIDFHQEDIVISKEITSLIPLMKTNNLKNVSEIPIKKTNYSLSQEEEEVFKDISPNNADDIMKFLEDYSNKQSKNIDNNKNEGIEVKAKDYNNKGDQSNNSIDKTAMPLYNHKKAVANFEKIGDNSTEVGYSLTSIHSKRQNDNEDIISKTFNHPANNNKPKTTLSLIEKPIKNSINQHKTSPIIQLSNINDTYNNNDHNAALKPQTNINRELGTNEEIKALKEELLMKKAELDQNIILVQEKNIKVTELKNEYIHLKNKLQQDYEEYQREKEKEKAEFSKYKEEEFNRIEKEKKAHQRNLKQLQAMIPSKKDREEMNVLKEQLTKLQEDTKLKDTRNKKAMDRLRHQYEDALQRIEELEKEGKVKEEELLNLKLLNKNSNNMTTKSRPPIKAAHKRQLSKEKINHKIIGTSNIQNESCMTSANDDYIVGDNNDNFIVKELRRTNSLTNKKPINTSEQDSILQQLNHQNSKQQPNQSNIQYDQFNHDCYNTEETYDMIFFDKYHHPSFSNASVIKEEKTIDGKLIKVYDNGKREIIFPSGLRKEIFPDNYQVSYLNNNDIRQAYPDGKEVYKYSETDTIQTKFPNGLQVFKFSTGQIEKNCPDGTKIIIYPDGTIRNLYKDNYEETFMNDGTLQKVDPNGIITIDYPNGNKKTIYPNGSEITELPDGRIIKSNSNEINQKYHN